MRTVGPLQITNLVKAFSLFFFATSLLWAAGNYLAIRDVLICWPVFIFNVLASLLGGWLLYKRRYHAVLSYDAEGFALSVGERKLIYKWRDFVLVSLFHRGHGEFAVRLYEPTGGFVEIPVSDLRVNPQEFRFAAMEWVEQAGRKECQKE